MWRFIGGRRGWQHSRHDASLDILITQLLSPSVYARPVRRLSFHKSPFWRAAMPRITALLKRGTSTKTPSLERESVSSEQWAPCSDCASRRRKCRFRAIRAASSRKKAFLRVCWPSDDTYYCLRWAPRPSTPRPAEVATGPKATDSSLEWDLAWYEKLPEVWKLQKENQIKNPVIMGGPFRSVEPNGRRFDLLE